MTLAHQELGSAGTVGLPLRRGGFRVIQVLYRDTPALPMHSHPLARVCLTMEGGFRESIGGTECDCGPGTVLLRPPQAPHRDHFGGAPVRNVLVEIEPGRFDDCRSAFDAPFVPTLLRGSLLDGIPERIDRELRTPDASSDVCIEGLILQLMVSASRLLTALKTPPVPGLVVDAIESIEKSFRRKVSLSGLAEQLGVLPTRLAQQFKRYKGCSVGEFVRRRRVEFAAALLREGQLAISRVAVEAGFCDQAHLTREFKTAFGMTPLKFRRRNAEDFPIRVPLVPEI
jgi:AraC family transcriptional regulator